MYFPYFIKKDNISIRKCFRSLITDNYFYSDFVGKNIKINPELIRLIINKLY